MGVISVDPLSLTEGFIGAARCSLLNLEILVSTVSGISYPVLAIDIVELLDIGVGYPQVSSRERERE